MKNDIRLSERPFIPSEHPKQKDYFLYLVQNIKTIFKYKKFPLQLDNHLISAFSKDTAFTKKKFEQLIEYFLLSFIHHSSYSFSRCYFTGLPSQQGRESDSIEGAARSWVLLAALLHVSNFKKSSFYIVAKKCLKSGFLAATNKTHKGYWGRLKNYQQTICEAADFSLALWLSKDIIWKVYSYSEKQQILTWLKQVNKVKTVDNNWHLFILLTQVVIRDLSGENYINNERYYRIKEFYVGEGWFRDGTKGNFDYYNSWGFHYELFWIDQIAPDLDRQFIWQSAKEFAEKFRYFFTKEGFPFFGRSIPYRFAAPCALISSMIQQGEANGQVKRIISTLTHFLIQNNAIREGNITQGLFQSDRLLLDSYSGSGSGLWSLRSFILLLYAENKIPFWDKAEEPLEIEKGDFDFHIKPIKLRIIGIFSTQEVIAIFTENQYPEIPFNRSTFKIQSFYYSWLEKLIGCSTRPKNNLLRKNITCYSSKLNLYLTYYK